jgi:hypothetical protein
VAEQRVTEPSLARMGEITTVVWEMALREMARDGQSLPPDAKWLMRRVALSAPHAAVRCRYLMRAIGPEVAWAVMDAAGLPQAGVTRLDGRASQPAGSENRPAGTAGTGGSVSVREAARMLDLTPHGIRAACRRHRLAAVRDEQTGTWLIDPAGLADYARRRNGSGHR